MECVTMATATSQMDTSSATYPDPITDIDGTKTTGNDGANNSSTVQTWMLAKF